MLKWFTCLRLEFSKLISRKFGIICLRLSKIHTNKWNLSCSNRVFNQSSLKFIWKSKLKHPAMYHHGDKKGELHNDTTTKSEISLTHWVLNALVYLGNMGIWPFYSSGPKGGYLGVSLRPMLPCVTLCLSL